MSELSSHEVTSLLKAWCAGERDALDRLVPLVYEELHRAARRYMRGENQGLTLETTALINEVYLRLVNLPGVDWRDRGHFFAICARLMRRILVDLARSRNAAKRGAGAPEESFDEAVFLPNAASIDLLALDEALDRLGEVDERKSLVVEMRFFGGLSAEESAEILQVSTETVKRDWRLAKAWLLRELASGHPHGS
jgi:RNA polymerase sigma-70 factor (ECF subfamily)